jgi:hypothetical protein
MRPRPNSSQTPTASSTSTAATDLVQNQLFLSAAKERSRESKLRASATVTFTGFRPHLHGHLWLRHRKNAQFTGASGRRNRLDLTRAGSASMAQVVALQHRCGLITLANDRVIVRVTVVKDNANWRGRGLGDRCRGCGKCCCCQEENSTQETKDMLHLNREKEELQPRPRERPGTPGKHDADILQWLRLHVKMFRKCTALPRKRRSGGKDVLSSVEGTPRGGVRGLSTR